MSRNILGEIHENSTRLRQLEAVRVSYLSLGELQLKLCELERVRKRGRELSKLRREAEKGDENRS